jgi:hypothetical protein
MLMIPQLWSYEIDANTPAFSWMRCWGNLLVRSETCSYLKRAMYNQQLYVPSST